MLKHMILLLLLFRTFHMQFIQQSIQHPLFFPEQTKQQLKTNENKRQYKNFYTSQKLWQEEDKSHKQMQLKDIYSLRQTFPEKQSYCLQKMNIFQYFKCMLNIFWESKVFKIIKCILLVFMGIIFPPLILVAIIIQYIRKGAEKDLFQF